MSDTLADLSSWLPSQFLTADDNRTHFCSPSSTESESDDDHHVTGLTLRFSRSVSLQERLQVPYLNQKKRGFSSSPESTLNWNLSSPATPVVHSDEDSWERIYAAAGQIARMKMEMTRSILLHQRGPPPHHHQLRNCSNWMHENEEFIRQQHFHRRFDYDGAGGGRCGPNRPVGFHHSAWPPIENPRHEQPVFAGSGGGSGRPTAFAKKECAGTGVFLPRTSFSHGPPESKKLPACLGSHMPAGVVPQSFNKTMGPMNPRHQPNINHAELVAEIVMARSNHAAMVARQRRSTNHVGVPETKVGGPPEVVLPQEWIY